MQSVYVRGEISTTRQQQSKLVVTVIGEGTFMLAMPDTSRETACVGYAQKPKRTLLLWVTSKHDPPALFEGVCKLFNPEDGLLCGEAIKVSPIYISQSGLPCTMYDIALPLPHSLLPGWAPLCIDHGPEEPKRLFPQTLDQSKWCPLCTRTILGVPERPKPVMKFIACF